MLLRKSLRLISVEFIPLPELIHVEISVYSAMENWQEVLEPEVLPIGEAITLLKELEQAFPREYNAQEKTYVPAYHWVGFMPTQGIAEVYAENAAGDVAYVARIAPSFKAHTPEGLARLRSYVHRQLGVHGIKPLAPPEPPPPLDEIPDPLYTEPDEDAPWKDESPSEMIHRRPTQVELLRKFFNPAEE